MTNNVQPERRRRSMLITPGEAERPGAVAIAVAVRQPYLPPTVTLHWVELEKTIVVDIYPQSIAFDSGDNHINDWQETELGEAHADGEGGDIALRSW